MKLIPRTGAGKLSRVIIYRGLLCSQFAKYDRAARLYFHRGQGVGVRHHCRNLAGGRS